MTPEYYESVVLVAIYQLQKEGKPTSHAYLVEKAWLGNKTIIKAIARLEEKGRLQVTRFPPGTPQPHRYEILTPPNEYDLTVMEVHLRTKERNNGRNQ